MGYIGPGLEFGAFEKIDDISSGFDGSATEFNIQIGGSTAEIASLNQLITSISGVIPVLISLTKFVYGIWSAI